MFHKRAGVLLLLTLLATVACTQGYSGESGAPLAILRGTSPLPGRDYTQIQRFTDDVSIDALVDDYRASGEYAQVAGEDVRWWAVIPPIQNSAGYQLRVSVGASSARACLAPPDGPAAMMLTASAFLVALPEQITAIEWDGACS